LTLVEEEAEAVPSVPSKFLIRLVV
jgi:hypothetical protein